MQGSSWWSFSSSFNSKEKRYNLRKSTDFAKNLHCCWHLLLADSFVFLFFCCCLATWKQEKTMQQRLQSIEQLTWNDDLTKSTLLPSPSIALLMHQKLKCKLCHGGHHLLIPCKWFRQIHIMKTLSFLLPFWMLFKMKRHWINVSSQPHRDPEFASTKAFLWQQQKQINNYS